MVEVEFSGELSLWWGDLGDESFLSTEEEGQDGRSCDWLSGRGREWRGILPYPHPGLIQSAVSYSYAFVPGRPQIILGCHKTIQLFFLAPE